MEVPREASDDDTLAILQMYPRNESIPYAKVVLKPGTCRFRYDGQEMEIPYRHICALTALLMGAHDEVHERGLLPPGHTASMIEAIDDPKLREFLRTLFGLD